MLEIIPIVEGHGEVQAVPILLRRIAAKIMPGESVRIPPPVRVRRQRVVRTGELEQAVEVAVKVSGPDARILILLDANGDCPAELGPALLQRAEAVRSDRTIRVVLAKSEYECWFAAAADSISGHCRIASKVAPPDDPEAIRDVKHWLSKRMPPHRPYNPRRDQPALTKLFDLDAARHAPSFDKLRRDVCELLRDPTKRSF